MDNGLLFTIFFCYNSKNTIVRFYYLSYWLTYLVAIFGAHLRMDLLLNILILIFFVSRIQEKCETILDIYNWNNLVIRESHFPTCFNIEIGFTWILWILIAPRPTFFTIVDVLFPTFLCVQLCLLCLLDFLGAYLVLMLTFCIYETIKQNLFFVLCTLFIEGWLGFFESVSKLLLWPWPNSEIKRFHVFFEVGIW